MFDNKVSVLIGATILCAALWLVGGFLFGASFGGMICVILGIIVEGMAVGHFMDTPCPSEQSKSS